MNKNLKKFVKEIREELGKEHPTVMGIKAFHRRLNAAALISNDVFGEGVDPATILALYEYICKEEAVAVWYKNLSRQNAKLKVKESVIADAPDIFLSIPGTKMSN